jgi:2Fe-2S ferredoxin
MVKVRFLHPGGDETACDIEVGTTLMEGAVNNGIEEIIADCGGALSCASCHVYVEGDWLDRVGVPQEMENELLEFAVDRRVNSRLSCQIDLTCHLDGLVIGLPERQP